MNKIILPFFLLLVGFQFSVQAQLHPNFAKHFAGYRPSHKNISLFVKGNVEKTKAVVKQLGGTFKFSADDISSILIPANEYDNFLKSDFYEQVQRPYYGGWTMEDQANINNNVNPVHAGTTPLTQAYDGTNVVIGFLDSGLDFHHHDFIRANGKSRVRYLWSQIDTAGTQHPLPFGYGKDWDSSAINLGTCTHTPPQNFFGHGTLTTGVACGNSQQHSNYRGVAPNADIIFVAIDFNGITGNSFESCVADGAAYCFAKAAALGKPCVINASLGTYNGSHDATDLATQAIENLVTAQNGRAFVASAGNAGGKYMHLGYNLPSDSAYTFFNSFGIGGGKYVAYLELFSDYADWNNAYFAIGADKTSPNFVHRNRTNWMNPIADYTMGTAATTFTKYDTIRNNVGQQLGILESYCEKQNGHYFMYFGVYVDSVTNYTWRFMTKGSGKFDIWSSLNYTGGSNLLYTGLPTVAQLPDMTQYMMPDTEKTIVGAWNCSSKLISVGNYLNRGSYQTWQGNTYNCDNHQVGNHYPTSSKGPTRNGLNKPDISASGEWTLAANDLYWLNWAKTNNPNSLAIDTMHGPHKGTSAAAPVVSGAVALYFQKRPTANYIDVKAALTTCVLTDNFTGSALPNNVWGYGKLDAFKMLNCQGCTNSTMSNYNPMAQIDDGSCVYLGPIPYFKHPNLSYCTGDSIHLVDSSSNNPNTWHWVFDAFANIPTSSAINPTITYSKGGKHYINLTVSNNFGSKTYVDSILVTKTPSSNFTFVDNICVGYNSIISYSGLTSASAVYTYTFGGGISSGSGSGPYLVNWATPGAKSITLNVVDNGCVSSSANTINVNAIPVAKFTFTKIGTAASFTNQSTGATTYSWAFGDGASSTTQHPIHYYTLNGTFVITLLAQNGNCVNTFLDTIYITSASGIENKIIEKEDLIVTHNNAISQLQIKWLGDASLKNIELYNMQGQLLYKQKNITSNALFINTSSYTSGMYLAKYETENGIIISKKWSIER